MNMTVGCPIPGASQPKESLRPTAHIMRGTVRDTYDNAFCSSCRSCLSGDEYFEEVLAHRYKYCPYCGARFVNAD